MTSVEDLQKDADFNVGWKNCGEKLIDLLLSRQVEFARTCKEVEEIGRHTKFTLEIIEELKKFDLAREPKNQIPKAKALHNIHHQGPLTTK